VAQAFKPAASPAYKSAARRGAVALAGLETCDTAGLEACATALPDSSEGSTAFSLAGSFCLAPLGALFVDNARRDFFLSATITAVVLEFAFELALLAFSLWA